jgi:Antibiotic biosynthesis monooxygenase
MFIAMNRFRVAKGSEADFEQVWLTRDSHLDKVPGFVEFQYPSGPEAEGRFMLLTRCGKTGSVVGLNLDQAAGRWVSPALPLTRFLVPPVAWTCLFCLEMEAS